MVGERLSLKADAVKLTVFINKGITEISFWHELKDISNVYSKANV